MTSKQFVNFRTFCFSIFLKEWPSGPGRRPNGRLRDIRGRYGQLGDIAGGYGTLRTFRAEGGCGVS